MVASAEYVKFSIATIKTCNNNGKYSHCTKMKFPIKDFFSKYDQILSFLRIWSQIFYGKRHFLCSVYKQIDMLTYPWQRIPETAEKTSSEVDQLLCTVDDIANAKYPVIRTKLSSLKAVQFQQVN